MASGQTPLRVLYSFPHVLGRSGIGTTAYQQVLGLHRAGASVHVVSAAVAAPLPDDVRVTTTMSIGRWRLPHRAVGVDRAYAWHDLATSRIVARSTRLDVVHTWPLAATRSLQAARRIGALAVREAPNTHTAHAYRVAASLDEQLGLGRVEGHSHAFDEDRLARERSEYAAADVVTVASDAARDTFLAEGVDPDRLELHAYGYDPARFSAPEPAPPDRPDRPLTIGFLGSLEPRKGLHVALEAWQEAGVGGDARLLVRGGEHPGYLDALGDLPRQPGVDIQPFVDDPAAFLRTCDALTLPSFEEGSALVTYEAQASGCALLVSTAAGARCDHGVNGLVHRPGDVAELASHIRRLAGDHEELGRMRAAALERSRSLRWDDAGRELLDVYRRRRAAARA